MADRITDALRGKSNGYTPLPRPAPDIPQDAAQQQDGTAAAGYVPAELGPFECQNCTKFQAPTQCGDPRVQADPEVLGQVEAEGCCNFFKSAGRETQDQEHTEGAGEEAEEPESSSGG